VFWVFLSPLLFDKSVMVAVATGQGCFSGSDDNAVYCDVRMFTTRNKKYTPPIFIITHTSHACTPDLMRSFAQVQAGNRRMPSHCPCCS
jgi:hypothetical protein